MFSEKVFSHPACGTGMMLTESTVHGDVFAEKMTNHVTAINVYILTERTLEDTNLS